MTTQNEPEMMKVTIRNVRRTLAAGMSLRAKRHRLTREELLLSMLEKEFEHEEQEIVQLEQGALARYHPED